ncbi:MAG: glycosyltransferase family 4 protein [Candidatus Ancaeobacter aquaticus]|nr:glycosyltransferase family 4 protein [Candidatus Ancaeobacter aquaticus]
MKKKLLHIMHLHWAFPPIIGGVETHLTVILPELVKMGHSVSLLTGSVAGAKDREDYYGATVLRTPLMDLNWLYKRGLDALEDELYELFSSFCKEMKPDIIHAHNMHYFSEVHVMTLKRVANERNVPLILTAHNVWDDNLFLELTHKVEWDHIIAVSHFIKREIIGIGIDDRDITVVHHGLDQNRFSPNTKPGNILKKFPRLKGRRIIFHPARMGLAKGCDTSIKAIQIVRKKFPDALLVLAGSKNIVDWGETQQKDIAYFVNLIKHFKLEDHIMIDFYSLDEMKKIYALTEVVLYPSTASEPFGLTMLEAMASERPIIVTRAGGMPEIIKDGINGFVIPIRDFEIMAAKINTLLEDKRLKERLGYTGRQMVMSQYTKEKVTEDTVRVYENVLRDRKKKKKK